MTSVQEFKCVFCQDKFESKEQLQIHFRKHGDPNFGQTKGKTKFQNDGKTSTEKTEDPEMVNCDVCEEVFPTISKAITHKHKIHPDHDAKYFCPLCGKLFTMKHLYNKHMQATHAHDKKQRTTKFPCNSCDVDFLLASAMIYHNKFFHRQDTELPHIGHSKKVMTIEQEMLLLYYCPFCGDEYNNKMNLHKHMVEEHHDEDHPEDILRCPLCEAIFYHLDAYELHLTFHSVDDLYNETNEIISQITDFSLEAVPPLIEKVENEMDEQRDPTGLAHMLQVAMEDPGDSESEKKKRKKHKKSKKSAITLDEFLNMNQDVFGEGLDVQGIVEVPTQVVTNTLKRKQPVLNPGAKISSSDLQKLKKQGIVVKMKSNKGTIIPTRPMKIKPQQVINKTMKFANSSENSNIAVNKPNTDCTDVIAKLMTQSNSQIKIVKKTATNQSTSQNERKEFSKDVNIENEREESIEDEVGHHENQTKVKETIENPKDSELKAAEASKPDNSNSQDLNSEALDDEEKSLDIQKSHEKQKLDSIEVLRKISQHLTVKSVNSPVMDEVAEKNKCLDPELEGNNDLNDDENDTNSDHEFCNSPNNKSITSSTKIAKSNAKEDRKEVSLNEKQLSNTIANIEAMSHNSDAFENKKEKEEKRSCSFALTVQVSPSDGDKSSDDINKKNEDDTPLSALKNLSKFITVKPMSSKTPIFVKNAPHLTKAESIINTKDKKCSTSDNSEINEQPTFNINKQNLNDFRLSEEEGDRSPDENYEMESGDEKSVLLDSTAPKKAAQNTHGQYSDDESLNKNAAGQKQNNDSVPLSKTFDTLKRLSAQISIKQTSPLPVSGKLVENITHNKDDTGAKGNNELNETEPSHLEALKKLGSGITLKSKKPNNSKQISEGIDKYNFNSNTTAESPCQEETLKKIGSNITLKSNKKPTSNNVNALVKCNHNSPVKCSFIKSDHQSTTTSFVGKSTNMKIGNSTSKVTNQFVSAKSTSTSKFSHETSMSTSSSKIVQKTTKLNQLKQNEIYNIEDSEDEDETSQQSNKQNFHDNIDNSISAKKKSNRPGPACSKLGYFKGNIEKEINSEINKARAEMQNSLKKLGHNITIKSKNIDFDFPDLPENDTALNDSWEDEDGNSNASDSGKLKITELTDDQEDHITSEEHDHELDRTVDALVESPNNSDEEPINPTTEDVEDFESKINTSVVQKTNPVTNKHLNHLKNITIKSLNKNQDSESHDLRVVSPQCDNTPETKSKQPVCRPVNKQVIQKTMPVSRTNTVNTEVSTAVKTYQSETVIEEITTTVTKTIRTVNKTTNQEVLNTNESLATSNAKNMVQGTRPTGQVRNVMRPQVRPTTANMRPRINSAVGCSVRQPNQLVPIRPACNITRTPTPRMQIKKPVNQSVPSNRPLRIAPNINLSPTVKRSAPEEPSGHFSQFKKPKESLIPGEDSLTEHDGEAIQQFTSASHVAKSNISTSKIVKGKSTVTQIRNEAVSTSSQQLCKLGNMSGLKITKSSQNQRSSYSEVRNEISPAKRSALDAIERLQKQGLLIKRPHVENDSVDSEHSDFDET